MKLTPKQSRFVQLYLEPGQKGYLNATQAAIGAGYSEKTARSQGERLLTNVDIGCAIATAQAATANNAGITKDRWLKEQACIAFLDPKDLYEDDGSVKLLKDMPEDARRALAEFTVTEIFDNADGDQKQALGLLKKIKTHPKPTALRDIGDALGFTSSGKFPTDININLRFAYDTEAKQ